MSSQEMFCSVPSPALLEVPQIFPRTQRTGEIMGIKRKNVPIVKTFKDPRTDLFRIIKIVIRPIFKNKETSNLAKGNHTCLDWDSEYFLDALLTVENLDLIVCDHLINSVSLIRLKLPLKQGFYLFFCSSFYPTSNTVSGTQ